jgi:hypothetical protein
VSKGMHGEGGGGGQGAMNADALTDAGTQVAA